MVRQVRLLGGVSAITDGGEQADIGPAKCQALLAALALSAGKAVPVWRLADLVWGEEPPRTADRTLQSYATRLRKGLGPDSIVRTGAAYRLDVAADAVDVIRFQRHLDAGDIDAALAEWTGVPLAGLDVPGLTATVNGLVEQWLTAVETELARLVDADAPVVIGRLTELTTTHPYREGLWVLLMRALYRAGRQADALAAYRVARHNLTEHLGVEPGPALREIETLILSHDERLLDGRGARPPTRPDARPTGTVTFGFCEIADSGLWWARHRPEMATAVTSLDGIVRGAADGHGGYVFAVGGDSFGVAFGRAADAVAWAAGIHAAVSGGIGIKIGLHTGEDDGKGPGYFGPAVNLAARLAAAGHGGQTLVSATTAGLLDETGLRDLGTYRLDGVVAEQRVFQIGDEEHPPLRTARSRHGNLPRRPGRLIGRDDALTAIDDALAVAPVVTLVGPGGIGKTRLAVAAAARRGDVDGVWLIELAEIASPGAVPRAVAGPLAIKEVPGQDLTQSIVTALRSRRAVLVLDNCEHVIDAAAELAQAIADNCPGVHILATSREGLALRHGQERLVTVTPLEPSGPGAELFSERACAISPAFDPCAERKVIEEICRRLDGVPLAIELAAARTASFTPADLLKRLDDQLRLLIGGGRTGSVRHRTLRATIGWSYDLLSVRQRRLFEVLSVFTGPFDLAAAETIANEGELGAADVDDLLGDLVTRSMLVVESGPFGRRFRLLETMRQFAAERLARAGVTDLVAARHARWCLGRVTNIQPLLAGQGEVEGVARLDELWPNLRAAFDWACARDDRRLAFAFVRPIVAEVVLRSRGELGDWLERILAITPSDDTELIVFSLTWIAQRYKVGQNPEAYDRLASRFAELDHPLIHHARASVHEGFASLARLAPPAIAELRQQGDDDLAEQFELDVGAALVFGGQFTAGDARIAALAERYRAYGPPTLLHLSLVLLGYSAMLQGKHDLAYRLFDEAVGVAVPERTQSPSRPIEARAAFRRGDQIQAFEILSSHITELLYTGNMQAICVTCVEFINMMAKIGRTTEAALMLDHLDKAFPYWATLVAEAREQIDTEDPLHQDPGQTHTFGDREALEYMREILDQLSTE
ncbi:MAG: winged helix-turn-helix domain-containing protein [Streptosporangiaceae bacterium]|nr:winged helix-turn-helix domain-containing protein [Streptosporangiaceae bacterium]